MTLYTRGAGLNEPADELVGPAHVAVLVRHCLCLAGSTGLRDKTLPLPCGSPAFAAKTLPLPCGPQEAGTANHSMLAAEGAIVSQGLKAIAINHYPSRLTRGTLQERERERERGGREAASRSISGGRSCYLGKERGSASE